MIISMTSWEHDPDDPDDHDVPVDPDGPDDPDDSDDSGTTLSFLSSLGFLLSERTSGVSPVIFKNAAETSEKRPE